jgi:hypothetical protein
MKPRLNILAENSIAQRSARDWRGAFTPWRAQPRRRRGRSPEKPGPAAQAAGCAQIRKFNRVRILVYIKLKDGPFLIKGRLQAAVTFVNNGDQGIQDKA